MNEQVRDQGAGGGEKVRLGLCVLLVVAGIVAYYVLGGRAEWIRWAAVVAGIVLAVLVFAASAQGRGFWQFVLDSRVELRKVVWPDRQITGMTTLIVFVFVIVFGAFFWSLDLFLAWATKLLTGQGG